MRLYNDSVSPPILLSRQTLDATQAMQLLSNIISDLISISGCAFDLIYAYIQVYGYGGVYIYI